MAMIDKNEVAKAAETFLKTTECYLVEVLVSPDNQIVVEIDSDRSVGIDDCAALSRYIEERFDRDAEDYELEVGSAGITSPFKIARQYVKNTGNEIEIMLKSGGKFTGVLKSADDDGIVVSVAEMRKAEGAKRKTTVYEDKPFSYKEIKYAKNIIRF